VVKIVDSPIPEPDADQVLIKVVVSGSNPKDWKSMDRNMNTGDDIAGVVERVGANVYEFQPGQRVAAFHRMMTPHGSFAEYAIAPASTTFHIAKQTSFEDAAAIPLAALTAAVGLYRHLGLPQPGTPVSDGVKTPLVIYGASSTVGQYAIQLARRSNIHPILCIAGHAAPYVETLIDRKAGDAVVDYRKGEASVVEGLKAAAGDNKVYYAFDCISDKGSHNTYLPVLAKGAKATFVGESPLKDPSFPEGIEKTRTYVGDLHKDDDSQARDFGFLYSRLFGRGLEEGWLKPQRLQVVPGGLSGVQEGLGNLMAGKASAVKYVFRIAETPGVSQQL
jgi:NADPH:quinone reductase